MKNLLIASLMLTTLNSWSSELFKISPYTLVHTNNKLILNFELKSDSKLSIHEGESKTKEGQFNKDQLYKIELRSPICEEKIELKIKDNSKNITVFEKKFANLNCKNQIDNEDEVFGFISDTQEFAERHSLVAKVIADHHSKETLQFLVNGGDVVQDGSDINEWYKYFASGTNYLMDIPQIAVIGNHDYRGNGLDLTVPKLFQKFMRWDGSDKFGNMFFKFKNFNLIAFNSNFQISFGSIEGEFWKWIEARIIESKLDNKPVIIATHFPAYSSSLNRYTAEGVIKIQRTLVPMMEKYKVPLLLSGHTHMYERSFKSGVHYLVAGPAGGKANKPSFGNDYKVTFDENALTFTKLKVSKEKITAETYNESNVLIDSFEINLKN